MCALLYRTEPNVSHVLTSLPRGGAQAGVELLTPTPICGAGSAGLGSDFVGTAIQLFTPFTHVCTNGKVRNPLAFGNVMTTASRFPGRCQPVDRAQASNPFATAAATRC